MGYDDEQRSGYGAYSDYTSEGKKVKKSHGAGKLLWIAIGFVLIGAILGGCISYGVLRGQMKNDTKTEVIEERQDDSSSVEAIQKDGKEDLKPDEQKEDGKADSSSNVDDADDSTKGTDLFESSGTTAATSGEMTVAQIAEKCLPSVVAITNKGVTEIRSMWGNFEQESQSSGSGVIIGETDKELMILTNYHVVEDSQELSVVFSWEEGSNDSAKETDITTAQVKDYFEDRDIAVITIPLSSLSQDTIEKIEVASIGSSDDLALGQQVVAIGNALGYGQSVTTGIVSALNRELKTSNNLSNQYIQTDAAINPGNSGGALFNMSGELVGINSAKIGSTQVEGMGYAIPISDILDDVETMVNEETREVVDIDKRGYLGVSVIDVSAEVSNAYGIPMGVYISEVNSGSGAENAGIVKGDIVTAINGRSVDGIAELKNYLSYYAYGETVTVTVQRQTDSGYESMKIDVVLTPASKSDDTAKAENFQSQESGRSGTNSTESHSLGEMFGF